MEKQKFTGAEYGGITFSGAVIVYAALSLIFAVICSFTGFSDNGGDVYIYLNYLVSPVAITIALFVVTKFARQPLRRSLLVKMPPGAAAKWCAVAVLLAFGLLFSLSWLNIGFEKLIRWLGYKPAPSYFPDLSGGRVALALFVMAVLPALFEEVLFRGAVLQSIKEETGHLNAVLLCGMCFALYHASALQTIYQFVCGCAFALLTIRSRSLVPGIIAHFLNNAVIIILQACGLDTSGSLFDWAPLWAAVLVTVLSALSLSAAAALLAADKTPFAKPVKGGVFSFIVTASVGIVILAVFWISGFFG